MEQQVRSCRTIDLRDFVSHPEVGVEGVFGDVPVYMHGLVHIALTRDAALALFEVAGTPWGIEVVESDEPVLHVRPRAHLGRTAQEHAHIAGAHSGEQSFLFLISVGVVDEGYLLRRYATRDQLRFYVVVDVEALAGRGQVAEYELRQLFVRALLPDAEHVVHTAVDLRSRLVRQQRVHHALVEAELAPVIRDGEHIVLRRVYHPRVDFRRALG